MSRPSLTIGIEEEYQTIDPVTRGLRSHIDAEFIEKGKLRLQESIKAEMHQSVVEVGTPHLPQHQRGQSRAQETAPGHYRTGP